MSALAVVEAELVEDDAAPAYAPLSTDEARALTGRLRGALEVAHGLLLQAYHGCAHTALGYKTWAAYCAAELADLQHTRLPRPQRRALVDQLHGQGMTRRAIATGLGLDESTVRADLRVVRDDERLVVEPAPAPPAIEAAPAPVGTGLVRVVALVAAAGVDGMTTLELMAALGWHHGQAGGALSRLHATHRLERLAEKRDRHSVYVVTAYVGARPTVAPRAR